MWNTQSIIALATALVPLVEGGIVTVQHLIGVFHVVRPEQEVDDDLRKLIAEALLAKQEADRAASGQDQP